MLGIRLRLHPFQKGCCHRLPVADGIHIRVASRSLTGNRGGKIPLHQHAATAAQLHDRQAAVFLRHVHKAVSVVGSFRRPGA